MSLAFGPGPLRCPYCSTGGTDGFLRVEITAHIPLGAAMQVGLRRAAAGWTSCAPSTSWEEQVLNFWMLAFLLASFLNDS